MTDPIDIGTRRELFVDDHLIERLEGAALHLHEPTRREVVFQIEEPLENACTGCYNITQDGDRFLLYYRGYHPVGRNLPEGWKETQTTNLLISTDGICFERPKLDQVEAEGTTANNIVLRGYEAHNFCVLRDDNPETSPDRRFKAIGGSSQNNMLGFHSADGLHWHRIQEEPLAVTGKFDSVNVALWDPHASRYRIFSRYLEERDGRGVRAIQSCWSEDFINWTEPTPYIYTGNPPLEHFYTNATVCCPGAEHILLSFPKRFVPERTLDTEGMDYPGDGLSDAVFMSSRDGVHWDRTFCEAWIRPGLDQRNWTHRNIAPAVGIVETAPDEWSMYIAEHYGWSTNRLRRVTVRPHGFVSLRAGYRGGEIVTKPLLFTGSTLRLNYSTSAVGSIRVGITRPDATPIEGFGLSDMEPLYGDELDRAVEWKEGGDLTTVAGQPVRLHIELRDADLFAVRTSEHE